MPDNRGRWSLAALLVLFAGGLLAVMNLAITRAPVYGDYSTMRSDPLGAKALYETLAALPGMRVERNLRRPGRLAGVEATVFWIGEQPWETARWDKAQLITFEAIVKRGGRLVIGLLPAGPELLSPPKDSPAKEDVKKTEPAPHVAEIDRRWQITIERDKVARWSESSSETRRETSLWLRPRTSDWRCLDEHHGHCRAAERTFGTGTIVLALDTFRLSNEGLREARQPAWIATLVGPWRRVIFDETHLGLEETGSVGTLIRQFRLEAAALMLVALAGLFIWRNSSSLLPPRAPAPDAGLTADPHRSMVLLLRRNVATSALLETCLNEWQRAQALLPYRHRRRAQAALAAGRAGTPPLTAWRNIRQALEERDQTK